MYSKKFAKKKANKTKLDTIDEEWDFEIENELRQLELEKQKGLGSSITSDQVLTSSVSTGSDTQNQASTSSGASSVAPIRKKKANGYIMFLHVMKREHGDPWETSEMTTEELIREYDHLWKAMSEDERIHWRYRAKQKNEKMNPKPKETTPNLTPRPVVPEKVEAKEEEEEDDDEWGQPCSAQKPEEDEWGSWGPPYLPR